MKINFFIFLSFLFSYNAKAKEIRVVSSKKIGLQKIAIYGEASNRIIRLNSERLAYVLSVYGKISAYLLDNELNLVSKEIKIPLCSGKKPDVLHKNLMDNKIFCARRNGRDCELGFYLFDTPDIEYPSFTKFGSALTGASLSLEVYSAVSENKENIGILYSERDIYYWKEGTEQKYICRYESSSEENSWEQKISIPKKEMQYIRIYDYSIDNEGNMNFLFNISYDYYAIQYLYIGHVDKDGFSLKPVTLNIENGKYFSFARGFSSAGEYHIFAELTDNKYGYGSYTTTYCNGLNEDKFSPFGFQLDGREILFQKYKRLNIASLGDGKFVLSSLSHNDDLAIVNSDGEILKAKRFNKNIISAATEIIPYNGKHYIFFNDSDNSYKYIIIENDDFDEKIYTLDVPEKGFLLDGIIRSNNKNYLWGRNGYKEKPALLFIEIQ